MDGRFLIPIALFACALGLAVFAKQIAALNRAMLERAPSLMRSFYAKHSFGHPDRRDPFWVKYERGSALVLAGIAFVSLIWILLTPR